ncbi:MULTISPECIES: hypothetical protein [Pseudoalteromonas]|uniref:hypothetical protein n=1 Tax=Pseudoalteromonas TaxID=53246 RepID=UPI0013756E56|nr:MULTISPECIES: hypothetical protein [unclassified Pseudoalteromonas]MCG9761553.1 hypothetical protein [Pseudoalteromonas sp. Isolate6]
MQLKKKKLKNILTSQLKQVYGGITSDGVQPSKVKVHNPDSYLKPFASTGDGDQPSR